MQISADSRWAVYSTEQLSGGTSELRSVPITGGTSIKLDDPQAVAGRGLIFFSISANSQYVVYDTVQPELGVPPLGVYSVPIDGGPSTKLGPTTSAGISPDSTFVLFYDHMQTGMDSIYQVPINGGVPIKLTGALGSDQYVILPQITPDSQHIVYTAAPMDGGIAELYSVPAAR